MPPVSGKTLVLAEKLALYSTRKLVCTHESQNHRYRRVLLLKPVAMRQIAYTTAAA